ncbi:MAG: ketopantoate reductase family protein [Gammaproteobacteria bacterium]|jgi:2-dehydropantoate 2-reductase|nr:ketopantoate reductase family protein [Gammaproteobacteria bacterium]
MKVCIIGCGAIGSLYAAHLGKLDDVEVWAYDLNQAHVDAINENGLRLTGLSDFTSKINARSSVDEIPECDFGIIATKTMFTHSAMEAVVPIFKNGAVCSVQNGIGSEEIVAEYVSKVIQGTIFPAGHITEPGVVNHDAGGKTWIGPFATNPASMKEVEQLADAINRSGMECLAMEDARGAQWTKVIFNAASNAVASMTRLPHGVNCDQPEVRKLMSVIMAEGIAVAEALGITLDSDPEALTDFGREKAYYHPPSMLQDVMAERQTEVDVLNGGIASYGKELGIPCPMNEAMTALIKGLEFSWSLEIPEKH